MTSLGGGGCGERPRVIGLSEAPRAVQRRATKQHPNKHALVVDKDGTTYEAHEIQAPAKMLLVNWKGVVRYAEVRHLDAQRWDEVTCLVAANRARTRYGAASILAVQLQSPLACRTSKVP